MSTQTNSQANQAKTYNLHTFGMGFINRLRLVKPEQGKQGTGRGKAKAYWCVSIGALYGVANEEGRCESSLFDLIVVGKLAKESVQKLQAAFDEGKKIFIEFKAGDIRSDLFQYKSGQRKDQWGSCIKGTLLQLRKAWVNGELVIDTSQQPDQDDVTEETGDEAEGAEQASGAEVALVNTAPATSEMTWQKRLEARPKRILIEKSDPEASDKLWGINATGCYQTVQSQREDCVEFVLIEPNLSAA